MLIQDTIEGSAPRWSDFGLSYITIMVIERKKHRNDCLVSCGYLWITASVVEVRFNSDQCIDSIVAIYKIK